MDEKLERKEYRDSQKRERLARELRRQFIVAALDVREGREFFWWLLSFTNCHATPFTSNALTTSFNCGQQNVGLMLEQALLEAAPDNFLKMLKEKSNDGRSESSGDDDTAGDEPDNGNVLD